MIFNRVLLRKCLLAFSHPRQTPLIAYFSTSRPLKDEMASAFFNNDTQSLLKSLTRVDLKKVYTRRKLNQKHLEKPVYKFMTDKELEAVLKEAREKADTLLQMPPVVSARKPINRIIAKDPAVKGLETSPIIFTDVTFGIPNSERLIVVRELDGTLREADWDVRDRMNQIYFPIEGRKLKPPPMFQKDYLDNLLKRKEYVFILDRACLQFEPDDPTYHRVTSETYGCINENSDFDLLRSTRHFGPLVFYLVWNKCIDNLLLEVIETSHFEEAIKLASLYHKIHKVDEGKDLNSIEGIKMFVSKHALKKGQIELALQAYAEAEKIRKDLRHGLEVAHGGR